MHDNLYINGHYPSLLPVLDEVTGEIVGLRPILWSSVDIQGIIKTELDEFESPEVDFNY